MGYVNRDMVLVPIPTELLEELGLEPLDVIRMRAAEGKIILEKEAEDGFSCDGDCENCPLVELDCDGDCENCPCSGRCDEGGDAE